MSFWIWVIIQIDVLVLILNEGMTYAIVYSKNKTKIKNYYNLQRYTKNT